MTEREAMEYIGSIQGLGIVPGLDAIRELCRRLGDPQDGLRFIQIAGTNGKGSTLAFLSTILQRAGYRVGRYLSPALSQYRDGIQVNGHPISRAAFCEGMELLQEVCGRMREEGLGQPTPFEVETGLALWYFRKRQCDIVVLEAGMGGRWDATNLVTTTITSVIASVGMDHMQFLGDTLEEIAAQKAGIIKAGRPVVVLRQSHEVMRVVESEARSLGSEVIVADPSQAAKVRYGMERQRFDYGGMRNLEITLAGQFQVANAVLAVEAIRAVSRLGFPVKEEALRRGLRETKWPGRFQVICKKPLFVVDGAHNEDAARKLAASVGFYFTNRRIIYIMGVLKDKDYSRIISLTHAYADQIITVTPPDNPRALHAYERAGEIAKVHPKVTAADSLEEAVEMSLLLAGPEDVILAFGSLSYLDRLTGIVSRRRPKKDR